MGVAAGWLMRVVNVDGRQVILECGDGRFQPTIDILAVGQEAQQLSKPIVTSRRTR